MASFDGISICSSKFRHWQLQVVLHIGFCERSATAILHAVPTPQTLFLCGHSFQNEGLSQAHWWQCYMGHQVMQKQLGNLDARPGHTPPCAKLRICLHLRLAIGVRIRQLPTHARHQMRTPQPGLQAATVVHCLQSTSVVKPGDPSTCVQA